MFKIFKRNKSNDKKEIINMFYEALPNELNNDWQEV